jgi:2-aminoadipate transaminase
LERVFLFLELFLPEANVSIATARRMSQSRRSFVREILKAAARSEVISFAGGLPSNELIPVKQVAQAVQEILASEGAKALQYCTAEGHPPLRQWVAEQYAAVGLNVSPDQILIISGSQQGFDLIGKVLIEPGDSIVVEDPTYIAALQAFGLFEPKLTAVPMDSNGIDLARLRPAIDGAKVLYCMPSFQNPTGISYSADRRAQVTSLLRDTSTVLVEDDPYSLLSFDGRQSPTMARQLPERTILLGTFSKILAPGLRLGWICAPMELMDKLTIAKQAVDLCSENLGQWVLHRLVSSPEFPRHLASVRATYAAKCSTMRAAIARYLPGVECTNPTGGMFLWLTLPAGVSALELFNIAIEKGVAFVPGQAFFATGGGENTLRLNFTRCPSDVIDEGIARIGAAYELLRA